MPVKTRRTARRVTKRFGSKRWNKRRTTTSKKRNSTKRRTTAKRRTTTKRRTTAKRRTTTKRRTTARRSFRFTARRSWSRRRAA